MKAIVLAAALLASGIAQSEPSAAKKELIGKVLKAHQPMVEVMANNLVEQPAAQIAQRAAMAVQGRFPPEKRDAVGKEIEADLRKYLAETAPVVRSRAEKLAPTTIGAQLDKNFTEDELKQLIAILESPVNKKFAQYNAEMQKALVEALVADTRPLVEPKIRALEQSVARRLGLAESKQKAPPKPAGK